MPKPRFHLVDCQIAIHKHIRSNRWNTQAMKTQKLAFLVLLAAACTSRPQVAVNGETLRGVAVDENNVSAFLGVPFAAPPIGELRWRGPQPYESTQLQRDATKFAPACMQTLRIVEWYRDMAELSGRARTVVPDLRASEDCLYLNVWTPDADETAALPVMVYVHGGSNSSGWSWEPNYHGDVLAAEGVVVVSIAYRVGDFGFFAHPDLDNQSVNANFGLWDQVAALRWIQENIRTFGGDPENVTLFGESAGAENIVSLMLSRIADDLFAKVILQSTAGFGLTDNRTLADERRRGGALAAALGRDRPLTIDELRELPAEEFLRLSTENLRGHYHAAVIDGTLIDRPALEKLAAGDYLRRRTIIGTNADEWYAYIERDADAAELERRVRLFFPGNQLAALEKVAAEANIRTQIDRIHTAGAMLCPSQYFAASVSIGSNPVWMYWFSRAREGKIGEEWRAFHGVELPYVFGTHDDWMEVSDADRRVTASVMSYWLQFARYGDPNSLSTPVWPAYRPPDFFVQNINDRVTTISRPDAGLCDLYVKELLQR
jgi:para-nitrobenzyl esterase